MTYTSPHAMGVDMVGTIIAAKKPADLFGKADATKAAMAYRRLALHVHPDRFEPKHRARAEQAMANLNRLYDELKNPKTPAFIISTRRGTHETTGLIAKGDLANVYRCVSEGKPSALKIARSPKSADLINREVRTLKKIRDEMEPRLRAFYPEIIDAFKHRDSATGVERRGVVLSQHVHDFMPLTDVMARFPNGLDPRDAAWMFRRLLVALGGLHDIGIVHGGVTPDHMLMHLDGHGLVLCDYTASCVDDETVPVLARGYESWYPSEVGAKVTPTAATDLYMAGNVLLYLLGDNPPRQLRAFAQGLKTKNITSTAWAKHDAWQELNERLYGPRRFRTFRFPDNEGE